MIADLARFGSKSKIPFDMFELERTADEARSQGKLRNIYHRGQDLAWDGRQVLADLIKKHGGIKLSDDKKRALSKVFEIILWGELAAWKISAELAAALEPLEAKMAATSQAHDEARHFYVMYDYLCELGYRPTRIDPWSQHVLDLVLETDNLAHKLLGMQMMIETIALTIFALVRELQVEPVLSELLVYYEKDEARHVGLGVQYLPSLIKRMTPAEGLVTLGFQMKLIFWEIASLKAMEEHFRAVGISPPDLIRQGKKRQMAAFEEMWAQPGFTRKGVALKFEDWIQRSVNGIEELLFMTDPADGWATRLRAARDAYRRDPREAIAG
jgi:hypothetical protein